MTNQLILDLDAPARPARPAAVRHSTKAVFQPASSLIEASRFALKYTYRGRSYLVRGNYHLTKASYLADDQISRIVDYVSVDRIFTYRNGGYAYIPVLKTEEMQLSSAVSETLKDPYCNPYLTVVYDREVAR
ncbi:MAG: hypothetical protein ACOYN2_00340 [Patescibacteria group bacterium]